MMKRYVIERDLPGVGGLKHPELGGAAKTSNAALAEIAGDIGMLPLHAGDKTFCIYLAENEDKIHEHAAKSGFPASKVTEVTSIIDPTTEAYCNV